MEESGEIIYFFKEDLINVIVADQPDRNRILFGTYFTSLLCMPHVYSYLPDHERAESNK